MNANDSIKTTGQLRTFLAKAMIDVRSGALDLERATRLVKLASQINENFYAEVNVAKLCFNANKPPAPLGETLLGGVEL